MNRRLIYTVVAMLSVSAASAKNLEAEALKDEVIALHEAAKSGYCADEPVDADDADAFQSWVISTYPGGVEVLREKAFLYRVLCSDGERQKLYHYYWYRDVSGLQQLSLAVPTFIASYETSWDNTSPLLNLTVTGMRAEALMFNSQFDPATLTITDTSNWSGDEPTGLSGTWTFTRGDFKLVRYDIDVSNDGQVNPITAIDYEAAE